MFNKSGRAPTVKEDICRGCQVLKPEIMSLRHEMNELRLIVSGKEIMQIRAESPYHTSNITLCDEITALKAELLVEKEQNRATTQDLKSTIKSLEEGRNSLLTAIRLINSDRQQVSKEEIRENPRRSFKKYPDTRSIDCTENVHWETNFTLCSKSHMDWISRA